MSYTAIVTVAVISIFVIEKHSNRINLRKASRPPSGPPQPDLPPSLPSHPPPWSQPPPLPPPPPTLQGAGNGGDAAGPILLELQPHSEQKQGKAGVVSIILWVEGCDGGKSLGEGFLEEGVMKAAWEGRKASTR